MIQKEIEIETMSIDDYAEIMGLWQRIKGFHIREVDDDYISKNFWNEMPV